jgi:U3 small nucleolar RNA-associated protein 7
MIAEMNSHKGEPHSLAQNTHNGIMGLGHSYGGVSLWTPNLGKPLVQMMCHPSAPIRGLCYSPDGKYMVTAGGEKMKIWDLRTYKELNCYFTHGPTTGLSISQSGLLAVSGPEVVSIWKDWTVEK